MYWTIVTTLLAVGVAGFLTRLDRGGSLRQWLWGLPGIVALAPPLGSAALQASLLDMQVRATPFAFRADAAENLRAAMLGTLEISLWSSCLVGTLCMVLIAFGRSGDGRSVPWTRSVAALAGMIAVGLVSPVAAAWLAPLIVLAAASNALPTGRSVVPRRRALAGVGVWSITCANGALVTANAATPDPWHVVGEVAWSVQVVPLLAIVSVIFGIGLAWSAMRRE